VGSAREQNGFGTVISVRHVPVNWRVNMIKDLFWAVTFGFMGTMFLALIVLAVLIKLQ